MRLILQTVKLVSSLNITERAIDGASRVRFVEIIAHKRHLDCYFRTTSELNAL